MSTLNRRERAVQEASRGLARLHRWLETVRQPGGYGGPVVHWWRHSLLYAGPAGDWRYEGILAGYGALSRREPIPGRFTRALAQAKRDLAGMALPGGSYRASQFERNPGTHGTPHEAAASLGLLLANPDGPSGPFEDVARANLDHLVEHLWDPVRRGFNDQGGVPGRVPNKLATFAEALLEAGRRFHVDAYWEWARIALEAVMAYQVETGPWAGAIHQYAPDAAKGDGRFFPYYNARCVPALLKGAAVFGEPRFREAADAVGNFLDRTKNADGSWPQIVYASGRRAEFPRWVAGSADILRAYRLLGVEPPGESLERLLTAQLESGAFPTAEGFGGNRKGDPDWHDLVPVTGWNDKVLRFLAEWLGDLGEIDAPDPPGRVERPVRAGGRTMLWIEREREMALQDRDGTVWYRWQKDQPWAWARTASVVQG